jgi:hypothetical protein
MLKNTGQIVTQKEPSSGRAGPISGPADSPSLRTESEQPRPLTLRWGPADTSMCRRAPACGSPMGGRSVGSAATALGGGPARLPWPGVRAGILTLSQDAEIRLSHPISSKTHPTSPHPRLRCRITAIQIHPPPEAILVRQHRTALRRPSTPTSRCDTISWLLRQALRQ